MFKFGFGDDTSSDPAPQTPPVRDTAPPKVPAARFLTDIPSCAPESSGQVDIVELSGGELLLRKSCNSVPPGLSANGADVVPGVYEGGFKLWECAEDLVVHVHRVLRTSLQGKSVLEIGAGHALPAIVAAMAGAAITVHDFNEEVLRTATVRNITMNLPPARKSAASASDAVRYIAGDWGSIPELVGDAAFDVVLSSETVYAEDQLRPLARCILSVLKDGGFALVAGKTYYFGVGGGMQAFRDVVGKVGRELRVRVDIEIVEELRDGRSNVREVTKIWRNKKIAS